MVEFSYQVNLKSKKYNQHGVIGDIREILTLKKNHFEPR